jgi:hypothetical protein
MTENDFIIKIIESDGEISLEIEDGLTKTKTTIPDSGKDGFNSFSMAKFMIKSIKEPYRKIVTEEKTIPIFHLNKD